MDASGIIEISETVRLDRGPALLTAIATPELLDDAVTAAHYHAGGRDALGNEIVVGQEMTYLDWKGESGFYVYELGTLTDAEGNEREGWVERGFAMTEDEAREIAADL